MWQFPVILVPFGTEYAPDSVVLRPIDSVDGMTAQSCGNGRGDLLDSHGPELLQVPGVAGVFLRSDPQAAGHDRVGVAQIR